MKRLELDKLLLLLLKLFSKNYGISILFQINLDIYVVTEAVISINNNLD